MPNGDTHTQEIRFAVVLYGGVSLAIYINGVVQELLRLVRSTSDQHANTGSEAIYRKLGQILERGQAPRHLPGRDDPVKTRFKIDIISGTSAGGINGIFLAKALANEADLTRLQELWFKEGAIKELLNDRRSYAGLGIRQPDKTESLLNSRRMYQRLLKAFDDMEVKPRPAYSRDKSKSRLTEEIDLFATTTDIEGVPVPIRLLDNVVFERRYRNVFHLRFIEKERNDFQADNNPFLAFAARCTSAFPFAFEPMRLCDIDEVLSQHDVYRDRRFKYCRSGSTRWEKFYTDYLNLYSDDPANVLPGVIPFPQRSFGDGGYLNNAPFSYAVEALLARQSGAPVDRKLLYVEPSPTHPEEVRGRRDKPNAVENSLAALITIPGYQTIRTDLGRMLERNREAAKINKTIGEVETSSIRLPDREPDDGEPAEIRFQSGDCYLACYEMRASDVTDRLAVIAARTLLVDEESVLFIALRSLIRAWRERAYPSRNRGGFEGDRQEFLERFDLAYRVRRLRFVLRKLDALYGLQLPAGHPARSEAVRVRNFALRIDEKEMDAPKIPAADLEKVWEPIANHHQALNRLQRRLSEKPLREDKHTPREALGQPKPNDPVEKIRSLLLPLKDDVSRMLLQIAGIDRSAQPQARPDGYTTS
jgi:patatin-related protein